MGSGKLDGLVGMSNRYGRDPRYVLAGGGNSSWKNERKMYVKSSGTSLANITAEGFTGMDRDKLRALLGKTYDARDESKRDAKVLSDMMDARLPGFGNLRPSVETLLHELFPYRYVLHLHPALVNGMTCAARGEETARAVFGDDAVWIPEYKPGYELAKLCEKIIAAYVKTKGTAPKTVFLQNHGVFAAADGVCEIDALYGRIMGELGALARIKPAAGPEVVTDAAAGTAEPRGDAGMTRSVNAADNAAACESGEALAGRVMECLAALPSAPSVTYRADNSDIAGFLENETVFRALGGAFTPDHIVYCKARFLYIGCAETTACAPSRLRATLTELYAGFIKKYGYAPRVICVKGAGAFICADTAREADNALALFNDAVQIAVYSQNFGGPRHLSAEMTDFIENWELEHYRQKVAQS